MESKARRLLGRGKVVPPELRRVCLEVLPDEELRGNWIYRKPAAVARTPMREPEMHSDIGPKLVKPQEPTCRRAAPFKCPKCTTVGLPHVISLRVGIDNGGLAGVFIGNPRYTLSIFICPSCTTTITFERVKELKPGMYMGDGKYIDLSSGEVRCDEDAS